MSIGDMTFVPEINSKAKIQNSKALEIENQILTSLNA